MQNHSTSNPDSRALPDGWIQCYESSKCLWYYVQITAVPPQASFTHPADLVGPRIRIPSPHGPHLSNQTTLLSPMNTLPSSFMTPAQRLYASSGNMSVAPMIGAHENLSTAPEHSTRPASPPGKGLSIFHTPPPSASPSRNEIRSSPTHLPPSRLAARGDGLYSSAVSSPQGSGNNYTYTTIPSNSSYFGSERLQPHRMFTSPSPVPSIPTSRTSHGRHHAYSVGPALQSASSVTSAMSGPRPTPHLITKARPPPESAGNQFNPLVNPNGASASTNGQLSPINLGSPSPPSSSLLFSQAPANQILSPVSPPLSVSSSVSLSPVSTIPVTVAHSASTNVRLQHDPTKLITMLRTAFSQSGAAISESDLQAVAYAQPNANYQTIIIALKRLQSQVKLHGMGMQQQQLLANYQALITQIENLRALAQPQLQQALQQGQQAELLHQQGAMEAFKQQQAALAHQQALLQQQAQQEAQLKIQMLHQQQQTAAAALQAQQQQQQQQIVAQQQALLQQQEQANQLYQQKLQALQQQMAQQQQTATNMTQTHQSTLQQAQQQQQSQQQQSQQQQSQQQQQNQSNTASEVVSHLANALMGNGSGQSNQTEPTPSGDTGNSLFGTIAQGFLNSAVGNNQDPTSGISNLFGGITQAWMDSAGGVDPSGLAAGLDFSDN